MRRKKIDKRILKTILVFICALITSALVPIFAQWYHQKTGIYPVGTIALSGFGGLALIIISVVTIWEEI
jgi:hypothetical protein